MFKSLTSLLALLMFAFVFTACDDEENTGPGDNANTDSEFSHLVNYINTGEYTINLFATEAPYVGYNTFKLEVLDSDDRVLSIDDFEFLPTMNMGDFMHSTPRMAVTESQDKFDIVFLMPSMPERKWNVALRIEVDGKVLEQDFEMDVLQSDYCKVVGGNQHHGNIGTYISALKKADWKVGLNDAEFFLFRQKSMMQFFPFEGANIGMEPDMPSMGHGSNNNVAPEESSNVAGSYTGTVNFTMSGRWRLTMHLDLSAALQEDVHIHDIEMFVQVP